MKAARKVPQEENGINPGASGAGVDIYGGPVVDPTKNVLDLVRAEAKYQDAMRESAEKYQDDIRDAENRRLQCELQRLDDLNKAENRRLEDLAKAEKTRVDGLDEQRVRYETRIAEDLRVNVKTTSDQLAGQLIKETGALYNQITTLTTSMTNQVTTLSTSVTNQITGISAGINTRLEDLERFRWETGGKTAFSDPALTSTLAEMAKSISSLKDTGSRTVGQEQSKVAHHSNIQLGLAIAVGFFAFVSIMEPIIFHFFGGAGAK